VNLQRLLTPGDCIELTRDAVDKEMDLQAAPWSMHGRGERPCIALNLQPRRFRINPTNPGDSTDTFPIDVKTGGRELVDGEIGIAPLSTERRRVHHLFVEVGRLLYFNKRRHECRGGRE